MESSSVTQMTQHEATILELLKQRAGQVVSPAEIFAALYGDRDYQPTSNTIQVFMGRLRKKIDATMQVTTYRGKGYQLDYVAPSSEVAA